MKWEIKHINQKCGKSCVAACLEMITGKPQETFISKWGRKDKTIGDEEVKAALRQHGFYYIPYGLNTLVSGRVYIITVPSLNLPRENHAIVIDFRGKICRAYDPQAGISGKLYYKGFEDISGFGNVLEILKGDYDG